MDKGKGLIFIQKVKELKELRLKQLSTSTITSAPNSISHNTSRTRTA